MYESKADLRRQIQEQTQYKEKARDQRDVAWRAVGELLSAARNLGLIAGYDRDEAYTVELPEGATLQTQTDRDEYAKQMEKAREDARREALQTVIDALKLKDYGYHEPGEYFFSLSFGDAPTDRLWADLQKTLEVRAQRKAQADAEATEARVSRLGQKESEGGVFSLTFRPVAVDDADNPDPEFVENTVTAVKLADAAERTKKASKKSKDRP